MNKSDYGVDLEDISFDDWFYYAVPCKETITLEEYTFEEGKWYLATFPLQGQTYYFPEGTLYPWYFIDAKIKTFDQEVLKKFGISKFIGNEKHIPSNEGII